MDLMGRLGYVVQTSPNHQPARFCAVWLNDQSIIFVEIQLRTSFPLSNAVIPFGPILLG
jgi:hypothetical protein